MRNLRKRLLALVLSLVMTVSLLPGTAYAAVGQLLTNAPEENEALLEALSELAGPEDAREFYALLQEYGLLDEDGQFITDQTIDLDGEEYTLEEMEALLAGPDTDLSQVAEVDGVPITLRDLATVIAIEREIQYLQETYFSGATFEGEARDNLNSLLNQLQTQGLTLSAAPRAAGEQVVLSDTGNANVEGYTYHYISTSSPFQPEAGDTFSVKFKLAIPDAIQKMGGDVIVGFRTSLTGTQWLSSQTVAVKDAGSTEYTLTAEGNWSDYRTLYLGVLYKVPSFGVSDGFATNFYNYSFGDLYGAVSFYEPEGFLFREGSSLEEDWNCFFDMTLSHPELVKSWTRTEAETDTVNSSGKTATFWITKSSPADFQMLDKTLVYLQNCIDGLSADNAADKALRFRIETTLSQANDSSRALMCNFDLFRNYNSNTNTSFTVDGNSGEGFPINISSGDSQKIIFEAYKIQQSSAVTRLLPQLFYVTFGRDTEVTDPASGLVGELVSNISSTTSNTTVTLEDPTPNDSAPNLTVTAPAGTYQSGDLIPINIYADEYIQVTDETKTAVQINGEGYSFKQLHASTDGKFISLLYEVKEIDNSGLTVSITDQSVITDFFGNQANENMDVTGLSSVSIDTPLLKNAVESLTASYDGDTDEITFSITADQDEKYRTLYTNSPNGTPFQLLVNGTVHPVTMDEDPGNAENLIFKAAPYTITPTAQEQTVTVQLQVNEGTAETPDWTTVHRLTKTVTVAAQVDVTKVEISVVGDALKPDSEGKYTIALSDETTYQLQAAFTPANATYQTGTWSSDNESVATITADEDDPTKAQIELQSATGEVSFTFTADNGGKGDEVKSDPITFIVTAGDQMILNIPQYARQTVLRDGEDAAVSWVTNAFDFYPGEDIDFTVALYKGTGTDGEPVKTYTVENSADSTERKTSLTIPEEDLEVTYPQSEYTVKVSMSAPEAREATASLTVLSLPTRLGIQGGEASITDDKTLGLTFTVANNETATGTVTVTRMAGGETEEDAISCLSGPEKFDQVGNGAKVTFTPQKVADTDLYDTYTITFTENLADGVDESFAPGGDSLVVRVYQSGALRIVTEDGQDTITLSNADKVNDPTKLPTDSAKILALRQELGLIEYVSINADEHDWSSFSDGIKWAAANEGDADVAVNYQQGGLWDDVLDLSYETYLPQTRMAVSATLDGTATVTATHAATNMSDSVTVNVDTLRDQLYLFQVSPARETALTYTDGAVETKTVYTNGDGLLALYEPNGIDSDVSLRASSDPDGDPDDESDTNPLLGTIPKSALVSGERDAAKLQLYPLNTTTLVPAAQAELYLVKPDGTPYEGEVILRGGVYLEGHYCQTSDGDSVNMGENAGSMQPGNVDNTFTTDGDGKLTVSLNATQFNAEGYDGPLTNAALEYWFELRFEDEEYFPMLVNIQGTMSADRILRTGSAVVVLEEVPNGQEDTPFLTAQTVAYGRSAADGELQVRDVLGSTGKVGPNSTFKYAELTSYFMLWGLNTADGASTVSMTGETGAALPEQEVEVNTFPFAYIPVVTNTTVLTQATMTDSGWLGGKQAAALRASVYQNGQLVRDVPMSFQAADLTNVTMVDENAAALLVEMKGSISTKDADFSFQNNQVSNAFNRDISEMLTALDNVGNPMFKVLITPTEDNTVFNALIWGGYNSLDIGDVDYSGADGSVSMDYSLLDTEWGVGTPPVNDLSAMAQGTYDPADDIQTAMIGGSNSGVDIGAQLEGYYEGQFYYDTDRQEWVFRATGGGMTAGASLSFQANLNAWVGIIPVTATFGAGIALQLDFQTATVYADQVDTSAWTAEAKSWESVNDYLTTLRLNGYINAFGGFGFDYSILALKIGLYGELSGDSTNTFLSRTYLADTSQRQLDGQGLSVNGEVGIKFYAKFLFISYETVIGSGSFSWKDTYNDYGDIANYWGIHEDDDDASGASFRTGPATLLSRSYLTAYANSRADRWSSETPSFEAEAKVVQDHANPGSEPAVNDDGSLSVYISDQNSESFYDSRIYAGSVGTQGSAIGGGENTGYGDMSPSLAGTKDFSVAAWVRLTDKVTTDSPDGAVDEDDVLTADEQKQLLNSTEVMAAVYNGTTWTTSALTFNASPDLAPVAVVGGDNAAVFWRSVYASDPGTEGEDLLDFDTRDAIYVSFYDKNTQDWSEARMVYNGSTGTVAGIQAAMLPDGTALVAFILDRGSTDKSAPYQGYELAYRTVESDGTLGDLVVLTNDTETDTNPQVAAVKNNDTNYFLLAWYSTQGGGDIRLQAVDAFGQPHTGGDLAVPASVNAMTQGSGLVISADFRLAKRPAGSDVEGLTLVWPQVVNDPDTGKADHSVLYGIQLCDIGNETRLSAPQALVTLPDRTLANAFSAWQDNTGKVSAYIFGTYYDPQQTVKGDLLDENGNPMYDGEGNKLTYTVPVDTDQLLTGGGAITVNAAEVDAITVDYANLQTESFTPVVFTVRNTGASRLENIEVKVGSQSATLAGPLDPGRSAPVTVMYQTGSTITNPDYSVKTAGGTQLASGTLYLDYNDIGISSMKVVREEAGERDVLVTLYNDAAAKLADAAGRTVELIFYTDSQRTQPAAVTLSVIPNGASLSNNTITLSGDALGRIDQGSMTVLVTYDLADYVTDTLKQDEVPESGVQLYADVRVKDSDDKVMAEYATGDNQSAVRLTGLYARTGQRATLDVAQDETTDGAATTAQVTLTNNSLQKLSTGTLMAALLDGDGNVLETRQVDAVSGSDSLDGESVQSQDITFTEKGSRVVVYAAVPDPDTSTTPDILTFDGLSVTIDDFVQQTDGEGNPTNEYTYELPNEVTAASTVVTAFPGNGTDTVTVNGQPLTDSTGKSGGSATVTISGTTDITVTIGDKTYTLTVTGPGGSGGGPGVTRYTVTVPDDIANGTVTVSPTRASRGQTVTVTATPDEGYELGSLTVTDRNGNTVTLTPKGENQYTFTMPSGPVTISASFRPAGSGTGLPFVDVAGSDWFYDAVAYVYQNGLMAGTSATTFEPNEDLTRAMMVTVLWAMEGGPVVNYRMDYDDVSDSDWYAEAVRWGTSEGVVNGVGDNRFDPDRSITREEMAVMLYAYAVRKGYDVSIGEDTNILSYADALEVSEWAIPALQWACGSGMIGGKPGGVLDPTGTATRAEVATILRNFHQTFAE